MKERNHTIITISTFCGMILTIFALLGFVWAASAKNSKLDTACGDIMLMKRVDSNLLTTTSANTTAIALLQKDILYIREGIDDLKRVNGLPVVRIVTDPNR
jgi:hypothetical protein